VIKEDKKRTESADGVLRPVVSDQVGLARRTHDDVLQISPCQPRTTHACNICVRAYSYFHTYSATLSTLDITARTL